MGLIASSQLARAARPLFRGGACCIVAVLLYFLFGGSIFASGQSIAMPEVLSGASDAQSTAASFSHSARTRRFLGGRIPVGSVSAARAMETARPPHGAMLVQHA